MKKEMSAWHFLDMYTLGVGWFFSLLLEPKIRLDVYKIVSPAPLWQTFACQVLRINTKTWPDF